MSHPTPLAAQLDEGRREQERRRPRQFRTNSAPKNFLGVPHDQLPERFLPLVPNLLGHARPGLPETARRAQAESFQRENNRSHRSSNIRPSGARPAEMKGPQDTQ
eukprot:6259076-Pyramimonas_sp.AAC.1